jgi:hypothetical protein
MSDLINNERRKLIPLHTPVPVHVDVREEFTPRGVVLRGAISVLCDGYLDSVWCCFGAVSCCRCALVMLSSCGVTLSWCCVMLWEERDGQVYGQLHLSNLLDRQVPSMGSG